VTVWPGAVSTRVVAAGGGGRGSERGALLQAAALRTRTMARGSWRMNGAIGVIPCDPE